MTDPRLKDLKEDRKVSQALYSSVDHNNLTHQKAQSENRFQANNKIVHLATYFRLLAHICSLM
jgi:hypothetical protein